MTLGGYNGSTNDCARVSGALPDDTNEASDKGVCEGCVVVGNSPQESPYIFMAMHLWEAAEPTNTRASATRATATQPGSAPAPQQPKTRVFKHLPAAGKHARGSPATSPPAATAGARAGRTPLADREPRLSPTRSPSPSTSTTQASGQGLCRLGCAHRCAKKLLYGRLPPPSRPGKRAISRRSPPPTSSTCMTATQSSLTPVMLRARWAGVLRTLPHRPQPA